MDAEHHAVKNLTAKADVDVDSGGWSLSLATPSLVLHLAVTLSVHDANLIKLYLLLRQLI